MKPMLRSVLLAALLSNLCVLTLSPAAAELPPAYASHFTETVAIGAFDKFAYEVTDASHTDTFVYASGDTLEVAATYQFTTEQDSVQVVWLGSGSFALCGAGTTLEQITLNLTLTAPDGEFEIVMTHINDLASNLLDEDLLVQRHGTAEEYYHITKSSHLSLSDDLETLWIQATVDQNGVIEVGALTQEREFIDPSTAFVHVVATNTPRSAPANSSSADFTYWEIFDEDAQLTATFTSYSLTRDGKTMVLGPDGGHMQTRRSDDDAYDFNYSLQLSSGGVLYTVQATATQTLGRPEFLLQALRGDWSWSEFGEAIAEGAGTGAVAGAVTGMISTDSAAPVGAGTGAAVGAVAGAAGGAAGYCIKKLWKLLWGEEEFAAEDGRCCECEAFAEGFGSFTQMHQEARACAGDELWVDVQPGQLFQDGFGQDFPTYLEAGDRGNVNVARDLCDNEACNHWLADSAAVVGPLVIQSGDRWLAELCLRIDRKGPRQDLIPAYHGWKDRLTSDPELDFVAVLMDSSESGTHARNDKFVTYMAEAYPGYDRHYPDLSNHQEILPDGVFVPGTRIIYYYSAFRVESPLERASCGPFDVSILPGMAAVSGEPYAVQWPSALLVCPANQDMDGARRLRPALELLNLSFDEYDYLFADAPYSAPMARSFGGSTYNPGGYGNSGCTLEQLLGYRLILVSSSDYSRAFQADDFAVLRDWLTSTDCGLSNVRRGILLDGNSMAAIMAHPGYGLAPDFANNVLGVALLAESYREYNEDWGECVLLEPEPGGAFAPLSPGVSLHGGQFNVIGVQPGIPDVSGNLEFYCHDGGCLAQSVDYAQILRHSNVTGGGGWKSVVSGFGLDRLAERACGGGDCSADSACAVAGIMDMLAPCLTWLQDGAMPFELWRYPCVDTGVEREEQPGVGGPADYLYPCRPVPSDRPMSVRLHLAARGPVSLQLFDVAGRLVRNLVKGEMEAGESTLIWDGLDDTGRPVGTGVYWVQLRTDRGYCSAKGIVRLE